MTKEDQLIKASELGLTKLVKLLLQANADIHAQDDYALKYASHNGHTEVVKILLQAGANIHAQDDQALRYASYYGHAKVVKLLKNWMKKENKA